MSMLAFVSGATAGIGEAIAQKLAEAGYRLILAGRRADRLQALAQQLHGAYGTAVWPLQFDLQDAEACNKAIASLPEAWRTIDVLVNNAGLSQGLHPVHEGDWADWDRMIDTNVKGLLRLSQLISRAMIARNKGHILMVSSIAGKEVYANGNVYCASKHAVEAITKSMRLELNPYGIKVSSIAPGLVETEFSEVRFKGDVARAAQVYQGFTPLKAEDVAEAVLFMLNRPAHVNIADLTILPTAQASSSLVHKQL
jgi:3-hydroxy acid dehydrogenase / malonic semialdehyde reductase